MPPAAPGPRPAAGPSFRWLVGLGVAVVALGLAAPRLVTRTQPEPKPATPPAPAAQTPAPDFNGLWKWAAGLALVAVAVAGVSRYLSRRPGPPADPNLELVASVSLGPRAVVHLVRVADRTVLIGVDLTGAATVAEMPATAGPREAVVGPVRVATAAAPTADDLAAFLAR